MNGIVKTGTCYSGCVRLRTNTKGVVNELCTHNAGTRQFMDRIAQLVCGYSSVDIEPTKITATAGDTSLLLSPVSITGKVWGTAADPSLSSTSSTSVALCNAIITDSDIDRNALNSSSSEYATLKLLTKDGAVIAEVSDNSSNNSVRSLLNNVSPQTEGIIEWLMSFIPAIKENE